MEDSYCQKIVTFWGLQFTARPWHHQARMNLQFQSGTPPFRKPGSAPVIELIILTLKLLSYSSSCFEHLYSLSEVLFFPHINSLSISLCTF